MRQNLKQAIDVAVPFAFWALIYSICFGALAGIFLGIIQSLWNFPDLMDFIRGIGFLAFVGALYGGTLVFLPLCLPATILFALLNLTRLRQYRQLPYISSIATLSMFYVYYFSVILRYDSSYAYLPGLDMYIFISTIIVGTIALLAAATRITLKYPTEKTKRKVKQQSVN